MATTEPMTSEPAAEAPPPATYNADFAEHVRTYNRFLTLLRSAIGLFAFVLAALYFFTVAHNPMLGTILLVIGVGVLLYGLFHNTFMNRDFNRTLET